MVCSQLMWGSCARRYERRRPPPIVVITVCCEEVISPEEIYQSEQAKCNDRLLDRARRCCETALVSSCAGYAGSARSGCAFCLVPDIKFTNIRLSSRAERGVFNSDACSVIASVILLRLVFIFCLVSNTRCYSRACCLDPLLK